MSTKTELRTLHFDLSSITKSHEFTLLAGGGRQIQLRAYGDNPRKLLEHRQSNLALGLLTEKQLNKLTHYCEEVEMSATRCSMRRIVFPSLDNHPLPEIAMAFMHIPQVHVAAAHARFHRNGRVARLPYGLSAYGVADDHYRSLLTGHQAGLAHALHYAAEDIQPPGVTAQAIVLNHPELGSVSPGVSQFLKTEYLNPIQNPEMADLVQYIQQTQPGTEYTWYNKSWGMWAANADGSGDMVPAPVDTTIKYKDGKTIDNWPTPDGHDYQGMPVYNLTDEYDPPAQNPKNPSVIEAAGPVIRSTLLATKNDDSLNGLLWSKQNGVTNVSSSSVSAPKEHLRSTDRQTVKAAAAPTTARALGASSAKGFTLKSQTSTYGVETYDLSYDSTSQKLTLPVKNWPSRYLGAYVQFKKQDGTVILRKDIPNWQNPDMSDFVMNFVQPSDSKNYLTWLSAGNAIFGIPVPPLTQKTDLSFPWPQEATKASLMFGGLGCASGFRDWDGDVDVVGVLGTGLVNYGIGTVMLLADVYVVNPFLDGLKGDTKIAFFAIAGVVGASALVVGVAEKDNSYGKFILSKLANIASSVFFGAVTDRAIKYVTKAFLQKFFQLSAEFMAQLTAEEALEAVPVAGWALRVASVAADVAALAATTVECVLSPATYSYEVLHTMDLNVTIGPDPTHGKPGFAPVWPAVANHYVIQVKFPSSQNQEGGTTYTLAGPMPGASDAKISVTFPGIPAGGKIEVIGNVYSDTDWLAGTWNSGWIDATPDSNDNLAVSGDIVELLVPLTQNTTYGHKQALAYSTAQNHYWQVATFTVSADLVSDFNAGGAPDAAIKAAFTSNGNTLGSANIVVNTPSAAWTVTDSQAGTTYTVATQQIYIGQVFQLTTSTYVGALNAGGATPQSLQDVFSQNNYPLPSGTRITVVTANTQWTIAQPGKLPLFVLVADGTNIDVKQAGYQLAVQNIGAKAPPLPAVYPLPTAPTGNALGALQNIIINDRQFELGYAYLASGQNMPIDNQPGNTNIPMYAMQSISTLGRPQEQIYVPTKGFSLPTFIAYDQFGLTPLFTIAKSFADELKNGPVPADIAAEFQKYGYTLPQGAVVVVVVQNKDWTIGVPDQTPLYELLITTDNVDGHAVQSLGVNSYPVPGMDNFFLEPQAALPNQPMSFYLRGINLDQPPGQYTFDYSSSGNTDIWGIFQNDTPFQEMAVHPNGYVIGLDNTNAKMFTLKLPANALPPDKAPLAMPLAGKGGREGLLDSPQAMTITQDGRILILETGTKYLPQPRVQAFDVMGNPVPSFSVNQPSFKITNGSDQIASELDQQQVSLQLLQAFQQNLTPALAPKAVINDQLDMVTADLDKGVVDATFISVLQDFNLAGSDAKSADFTVTTTSSGTLWYVKDAVSTATYDVRRGEDPDTGFEVIDIYLQFGLSVVIRSSGFDWKIVDSVNAMTFEITKAVDSSTLTVQQLCSWMPLRKQTVTGTLSYLDIAAEAKGYIYVLSVINNNYNQKPDPKNLVFQLDIYNPDGSVLLTQPQSGLNAGKITVDQYRSLFSLNYNVVIGPNARTEPGVSQWIPSTPTPA